MAGQCPTIDPTSSPRYPSHPTGDGEPLAIHILDGAQALPFLALDGLPAVVRALTLVGSVVVAQYDTEWQRLTFYCQDAWIRGGRLPAAVSLTDSTAE